MFWWDNKAKNKTIAFLIILGQLSSSLCLNQFFLTLLLKSFFFFKSYFEPSLSLPTLLLASIFSRVPFLLGRFDWFQKPSSFRLFFADCRDNKGAWNSFLLRSPCRVQETRNKTTRSLVASLTCFPLQLSSSWRRLKEKHINAMPIRGAVSTKLDVSFHLLLLP